MMPLVRPFRAAILTAGILLAFSVCDCSQAQDFVKEIKDLEAAAKKGDAEANYKLGWYYSVGSELHKVQANMTRAVSYYKTAANAGVAEAQYKLGFIYDKLTPTFKGVAKNNKQAIEWYSKAEANGVAAAKYALAQLYKDPESGLTDTKGYTMQIRLLQEAAKLGLAPAQAELAYFYRDGRGDAGKDYVLAMVWASLAAEQGSKAGTQMVADLVPLFHMSADEVAKAQRMLEIVSREIADNVRNSR